MLESTFLEDWDETGTKMGLQAVSCGLMRSHAVSCVNLGCFKTLGAQYFYRVLVEVKYLYVLLFAGTLVAFAPVPSVPLDKYG